MLATSSIASRKKGCEPDSCLIGSLSSVSVHRHWRVGCEYQRLIFMDFFVKYLREDLNLHGFLHLDLNQARLPIPPLKREDRRFGLVIPPVPAIQLGDRYGSVIPPFPINPVYRQSKILDTFSCGHQYKRFNILMII